MRGAPAGVSASGEAAQLPPGMPAFTPRDLEFVAKFIEECDGEQLKTLVHSLCPTIMGHELVKAGLLLALFGGVRKNVGSASRVPVRGDVHVLVVGDPGLGKSQLLQAAEAAAPRGLYVCGNTSTSAGLTVSVVKDAVTGDFAFEAGAMVLADRGVCCVDEFDKMTHEHQALLEAMEQQEVSVAKAGLVASLPARTTVLAAANPVGGHYNRAKSVHENLRMSPAILSRFDLLFILLDRPDEALDQCLSEHVLALHSGLTDRTHAAKQRLLEHRAQQALPGPAGSEAIRLPLSQRLKLLPGEEAQPLPVPLLKKYIAYARAYVHPRLSDGAREVLQEFYLTLRGQVAPGSTTPITARQLESLVRLAEARARMDLREEATAEDALDVVDLMREALYDRFMDDIACVDFRQKTGGHRPGSKAGETQRLLFALRRRCEREGRATLSHGEMFEVASEIGIKDAGRLIEGLNHEGDVLMAGSGQYKVRGCNPAAITAGTTSSAATAGAGAAAPATFAHRRSAAPAGSALQWGRAMGAPGGMAADPAMPSQTQGEAEGEEQETQQQATQPHWLGGGWPGGGGGAGGGGAGGWGGARPGGASQQQDQQQDPGQQQCRGQPSGAGGLWGAHGGHNTGLAAHTAGGLGAPTSAGVRTAGESGVAPPVSPWGPSPWGLSGATMPSTSAPAAPAAGRVGAGAPAASGSNARGQGPGCLRAQQQMMESSQDELDAMEDECVAGAQEGPGGTHGPGARAPLQPLPRQPPASGRFNAPGSQVVASKPGSAAPYSQQRHSAPSSQHPLPPSLTQQRQRPGGGLAGCPEGRERAPPVQGAAAGGVQPDARKDWLAEAVFGAPFGSWGDDMAPSQSQQRPRHPGPGTQGLPPGGGGAGGEVDPLPSQVVGAFW